MKSVLYKKGKYSFIETLKTLVGNAASCLVFLDNCTSVYIARLKAGWGKPNISPDWEHSRQPDLTDTESNNVPTINTDLNAFPNRNCQDTHPLCCFWASRGHCDSNLYWMRINCQKACGTCYCGGKKIY